MKLIDIAIMLLILGATSFILYGNYRQNKKNKLLPSGCGGKCAGCRGCSIK